MELKNKIVLVTGSSLGIGRETAIQFAKKGCKVIVTYHKDKKEGEKVFQECKKYGDALLLQLDISNNKSIDNAVKEIIKKFSRLDILVNNSGVVHWKELKDIIDKEIEQEINVNLLGLIKVTKAFLPQFYKQKEGIIINIASGAGKKAHKGLSVYCATKFGVRGFTQTLALELPHGVRTYCVNPGATATRMTDFKGIPSSKVAGIIIKTAEETLGKRSGDDIDVWEYV
ncbi:SDR family oxidoreductase [Candidatus Pacearchaeota archaeon]|nr:SDR family oxidoreductase [Candidatus Pacearchaeota archaeon]